MGGKGILARDDAVNVAHHVERTEVEGPGQRFALWVQGCPLRCPGCCNPHLQPYAEADWRPVDAIAEHILSVEGIEGVTFIGGEPFTQATALAKVARRVREGGLSVMIFTGYMLAQLQGEKFPGSRALLAETDLLVDGPYLEKEASRERRYIGSANQRVHVLSPRYSHLDGDRWPQGEDGLEIRWRGDLLSINGYPHPELTRVLSKGLSFFGSSEPSES